MPLIHKLIIKVSKRDTMETKLTMKKHPKRFYCKKCKKLMTSTLDKPLCLFCDKPMELLK